MGRLWLLGLLLVTAAANAAGASDAGFPAREKYRHVKPIELKELHAKLQNVVVIDVRSRYEYVTLHIKDAINVPLAGDDFVSKLQKIRQATNAPLVFYCNGRDCTKSYQAAAMAQSSRITDVFAYDAGIFEWARAYPDASVLLGKSPISRNALLSDQKLEQHMLDPAEFGRKVFEEDSIVVDVRDPSTARATALYPLKQRYVPLDNEALRGVVEEAKRQRKILLVYDNVGKQVQWLQYFLEQEKVPAYYFLKGGADGYLDLEVQRLVKTKK